MLEPEDDIKGGEHLDRESELFMMSDHADIPVEVQPVDGWV